MKKYYLILLLLSFGVCKGQKTIRLGNAVQMNGNQVSITESLINGDTVVAFTVDSLLPNGNLYAPEKYDTVKVLCQVSDTSERYSISYTYTGDGREKKDTLDRYYVYNIGWTYLYSVREKHNTAEGVLDAGISQC